jgi:hypothetical protein
MKHQKLLTIATVAGLSIGGLGSVAVAQGFGDAPVQAVAAESNDVDVETPNQRQRTAPVAAFQDLDTEADTEANTEADGEREGRSGHRGGCNLEAAATAIGIEEADLKAALESGDSIADVAEANGVDASVVIDAMVDAKTERIAEKVEEGRITQEQADEKLAEVETNIADRVNGVEDAA